VRQNKSDDDEMMIIRRSAGNWILGMALAAWLLLQMWLGGGGVRD